MDTIDPIPSGFRVPRIGNFRVRDVVVDIDGNVWNAVVRCFVPVDYYGFVDVALEKDDDLGNFRMVNINVAMLVASCFWDDDLKYIERSRYSGYILAERTFHNAVRNQIEHPEKFVEFDVNGSYYLYDIVNNKCYNKGNYSVVASAGSGALASTLFFALAIKYNRASSEQKTELRKILPRSIINDPAFHDNIADKDDEILKMITPAIEQKVADVATEVPERDIKMFESVNPRIDLTGFRPAVLDGDPIPGIYVDLNGTIWDNNHGKFLSDKYSIQVGHNGRRAVHSVVWKIVLDTWADVDDETAKNSKYASQFLRGREFAKVWNRYNSGKECFIKLRRSIWDLIYDVTNDALYNIKTRNRLTMNMTEQRDAAFKLADMYNSASDEMKQKLLDTIPQRIRDMPEFKSSAQGLHVEEPVVEPTFEESVPSIDETGSVKRRIDSIVAAANSLLTDQDVDDIARQMVCDCIRAKLVAAIIDTIE